MVRDRMMKLSGAERFVIGARMFESARAIVLASFPQNISEPERRRMLYERFYGEHLPTATKTWGVEPARCNPKGGGARPPQPSGGGPRVQEYQQNCVERWKRLTSAERFLGVLRLPRYDKQSARAERGSSLALDVGCSSFAFATARQVGACQAEALGVGGWTVRGRSPRLVPLRTALD